MLNEQNGIKKNSNGLKKICEAANFWGTNKKKKKLQSKLYI
jgi:hypothetical protein